MELLNYQAYILPFLITLAVSAGMTWAVRRFALGNGIVDRPESDPQRKIQRKPVPLLGGLALYITIVLVVLGYTLFTDRVLGGYLLPKHLIGLAIAGALLMSGGYLDDRYRLAPGKQIWWPIAAVLVVVGVGVGVTYVTNPFGGVLWLDQVHWQLLSINATPYHLVLFADLFTFAWLMGMMYTTKFLDGLDGLVSGITTIGALVLFFLSISQEVAQPETALLAIILAGACAGFLIFNFHPARIFLGEGGSVFTGFMLGVLAIISGAKIATAMLIMGIPILDVAWVIMRRLWRRESPFRTADTKHLHFQLLGVGFTQRTVVLLLYSITIVFGGAAIFLSSSQEKLRALVILVGVMIALVSIIVVQYRRNHSANNTQE